jgi:hypothetical protein
MQAETAAHLAAAVEVAVAELMAREILALAVMAVVVKFECGGLYESAHCRKWNSNKYY